MMKEVEPVVVFLYSIELRIGWFFWISCKAVFRRVMFTALEACSAKTVIPVPLATALHQFCSVLPRFLEFVLVSIFSLISRYVYVYI